MVALDLAVEKLGDILRVKQSTDPAAKGTQRGRIQVNRRKYPYIESICRAKPLSKILERVRLIVSPQMNEIDSTATR